ncbi:hypothetical protein [Bradyrhizobium tropiciagri]|uniref:hypothetical protein n=1 Tax=Bradyrhizobium tropiciagri TaxID=312253 RepID=UPI00067B77B7|nr:hypothetical protein [Bradyrhizobium tropiciagri]
MKPAKRTTITTMDDRAGATDIIVGAVIGESYAFVDGDTVCVTLKTERQALFRYSVPALDFWASIARRLKPLMAAHLEAIRARDGAGPDDERMPKFRDVEEQIRFCDDGRVRIAHHYLRNGHTHHAMMTARHFRESIDNRDRFVFDNQVKFLCALWR